MSNDSSGFSSKKAHIEEVFTKFEINELRRCHSDPLYFIENYVKIQHPMKGDILFQPYDYQKKLVDNFHNNRYCIGLLPRQVGKCLSSSEKIRIKLNGKQVEMEIGEFYEWNKFRKKYKDVI